MNLLWEAGGAGLAAPQLASLSQLLCEASVCLETGYCMEQDNQELEGLRRQIAYEEKRIAELEHQIEFMKMKRLSTVHTMALLEALKIQLDKNKRRLRRLDLARQRG